MPATPEPAAIPVYISPGFSEPPSFYTPHLITKRGHGSGDPWLAYSHKLFRNHDPHNSVHIPIDVDPRATGQLYPPTTQPQWEQWLQPIRVWMIAPHPLEERGVVLHQDNYRCIQALSDFSEDWIIHRAAANLNRIAGLVAANRTAHAEWRAALDPHIQRIVGTYQVQVLDTLRS